MLNTTVCKCFIAITLLIITSCQRQAYEKNGRDIFTVHTVAISVANLDSATNWYSKHLGFSLDQRRDFPESGQYTAILKRPDFQLELIQTAESLSPTKFLPDSTSPTLLQGYKKIVIQTSRLDSCFEQLRQQQVTWVYPEIRSTPEVWGRWFMIEDMDGNVIQFVDGTR